MSKKYTYNSRQKIRPICPDCGRIKDKEMYIYSIYDNKSIGCSCSDGKSQIEKYMFSLLEQLQKLIPVVFDDICVEEEKRC